MSIADFTDLMADEITHKALSSRDAYGAPTYGTGTAYTARVVFKPTWIRADDGTQVVARGVVWIAGTPNIDPQDQITLPDGTTPPILAVMRIPDENGMHHIRVAFG